MLAGGLVSGAVVGYVVDLGPLAQDVVFSFLEGGIVLNVVKEEVPEERRGHFPAFAGGAALYAVLLLLF